ncbi:RNA-guided pseudouridylation complex pseudouridine synthase subunit Cbf5 [Sulfolobus tengchongensis]|uniref:RNA-guided pseudouridylation complex pseudouridine synthase subunit Cbf5 n=1 Tax=Sulfolobus tengchongensis TaxID=207809 RepID=A0AAX4L2K6_9CREN
MPIGIENATKIMSYITKGGKEYICVMQVHCEFDKDKLTEVINLFKGEIYQRPPVRSSVKRRLRIRTIYDIEILDIDKKMVLLRISSDSGTYMRKLCHDIGIIYGCGAHMRELRRTRSGIFTETTNLVKLQDFSEALYLYKNCKDETDLRRVLIPMEYATCGMPKIVIEDNAVNAIAYGAQLAVPGIVAYQNFNKNETVALLTLKGELVAIGTAVMNSKDLANAKKGIVANLSRVFMQRDIYPKAWKKHER